MLIEQNDWATVWWKYCDDMLSHFHLIPERHWQTDGRTDRQRDRQNCNINIARQRVSVLTRDKNRNCESAVFSAWQHPAVRSDFTIANVDRQPDRWCRALHCLHGLFLILRRTDCNLLQSSEYFRTVINTDCVTTKRRRDTRQRSVVASYARLGYERRVHLSVRLSVTRWYWVKTNNRRIMPFHCRVAHGLYFETKLWTIGHKQENTACDWFQTRLRWIKTPKKTKTKIFNQ